jgi:hypothetical protein
MQFRPFIATPTHDARVHAVYTRGLLSAWANLPGCGWSSCNGTSLQRQRDRLVAEFVDGDCTHLLFVDSDIGWDTARAVKLAEAGKDFIGGTYCRKGPDRALTANLLDRWDGPLVEVAHVGTGFLLVSRQANERLLEAYRADTYDAGDRQLTSLFQQNRDEGTEDVSFCRRWRAIGGEAWMHTSVVLPHYDGNTAYVADVSHLAIPAAAE